MTMAQSTPDSPRVPGLDAGAGPSREPGRRSASSVVSGAALAAPILILGAPRSGTTWLAKIVDSHPDVLYRHEPDAVLPAPSALTPEALPALLARWAGETGARTAAKRPHFRKSWQPGWTRRLRTLLATAVGAAGRLPPPLRALAGLPIPDLGSRPAPRLTIKTIAWAEGAAVLARTLPDSRTIFILRHPGGQVASVLRGNRQLQFELKTEGTDMPFDEARTIRFAAEHGIGEAAFQALPDAAKYAWAWRAFNEPSYAALAALPNVHVVLYEALCAQPETLARRVLAFAGLDWTRQTADFVANSSTHTGRAGYYAIFRDAVSAADSWRTTMAPDDQACVRAVAAASPLARFWPDLVDGQHAGAKAIG
jgi:Sulfotransferase family